MNTIAWLLFTLGMTYLGYLSGQLRAEQSLDSVREGKRMMPFSDN